MQQEISLLRELQEFDLQIEAIHQRTDALRAALGELVEFHESLTVQLEVQRGQLEATRALMREKELELESNEERYNHSKAKLNHVSNTREYNALEREMNALRKIRGQLEEERDSLREALDGHEVDVSEKQSKTVELEAQIRNEEAAISSETSGSNADVVGLEKKRQRLKKKLPKTLFRRYEFVSGRRAGPALVPGRAGVCTGCNMRMPPQLFVELQMEKKVIQCPSCQRILHFVAEEEAVAES